MPPMIHHGSSRDPFERVEQVRIRKSLTAPVNPCRFVWDQTITSFAMFATTSVSHEVRELLLAKHLAADHETAANEIVTPATIWKRRDTIHPPIRSGVVRRRLRTPTPS